MIVSFGDDATADIFHARLTRKAARFPPDNRAAARRKLAMLNIARTLYDLRVPPGNRLEALKGDLLGWHSVRINDQWRVIFRWDERDARDVTIDDYH